MNGEKLTPQEISKIEIRELAPEKWWSGKLDVKISDEEFEEVITKVAKDLDFTFSGYKVKGKEEGFSYHFSRYPRRAFGPVAPIESHQTALRRLAEEIKSQGIEEEQSREPKFRVVLGLIEGYEREEPMTHNPLEVQNHLGENFKLTEGEIYSVGPWGKYTEPAVVIEGDLSNLNKVYELAEKFHQSRIAVEDLQKAQSFMVETKWCTDPDKE